MPAAARFEERGRAEVGIVGLCIDIAPEGARGVRRVLAREIGTAFDLRRGEAEVEAGEERRVTLVLQPSEGLGA